MNTQLMLAPPLQVSEWFNTPAPITLESLRGKVVVLHTFQMLCPGCVSHGIPQALNIHRTFPADQVAVIGLHTVFEHHAVMNAEALKAFIHEYRLTFPIGIDAAAVTGPIPQTMQTYALQGTPSLILIDRAGVMRLSHFGRLEDLHVGALLGQLLAEAAPPAAQSAVPEQPRAAQCDDESCAVTQA